MIVYYNVKMMKKEYDLDKMKWKKNPYAKKLKKQITIRLDQHVIDYFQDIAQEMEMPYQIEHLPRSLQSLIQCLKIVSC